MPLDPARGRTLGDDVLDLQQWVGTSHFSGCLGMHKARVISVNKKTLTMTMTVHPNLCREGFMAVSAVLAWFDEVSSYAFMACDTNARPGVSVSMIASVTGWVKSGEEVWFTSTLLKAGKTLGFADIVMTDARGRQVASGRHIKYLMMGKAFDVATHPWVLPVLRRVLGLGNGGKKKEQGARVDHAMAEKLDTWALLDPGDLLPVDRSPRSPSSPPTPQSQAPPASPATQSMSSIRPPRPSPPTFASASSKAPSMVARFHVVPEVMNTYGSMHGGAVAMFSEQLAAKYIASTISTRAPHAHSHQQSSPTTRHYRACWISVDYISPTTGTIEAFLSGEWPVDVGSTAASLPSSCMSSASARVQPEAAAGRLYSTAGSFAPLPDGPICRVQFSRGQRPLAQCHVGFCSSFVSAGGGRVQALTSRL